MTNTTGQFSRGQTLVAAFAGLSPDGAATAVARTSALKLVQVFPPNQIKLTNQFFGKSGHVGLIQKIVKR
ncbi:hypothetical protein [Kaistia algarum]|uniref:hypothetical protein n=1 Tax=Kaistia algarum TaxID=2083279 RepID=UPI00140284C6|nr:hypothetical protein [Kaistia algarum]MCX5515698.1 hypothetical protein [Kaistia algarum]